MTKAPYAARGTLQRDQAAVRAIHGTSCATRARYPSRPRKANGTNRTRSAPRCVNPLHALGIRRRDRAAHRHRSNWARRSRRFEASETANLGPLLQVNLSQINRPNRLRYDQDVTIESHNIVSCAALNQLRRGSIGWRNKSFWRAYARRCKAWWESDGRQMKRPTKDTNGKPVGKTLLEKEVEKLLNKP